MSGDARRMILPFEEKKQEIVDFLADRENAIMALATSEAGRGWSEWSS